MQLQTTSPESKFTIEYNDVTFIQIDQHLEKLLPKYKGVPILWNTVYFKMKGMDHRLLVRPIAYIVQLIDSPLLLLANCLTDLCKYTPTIPQHCWHGRVVLSLYLKRIELLQKFNGVNLSGHHICCLIGNRKYARLDHIWFILKITILSCDVENRPSRSRSNMQNSLSFTLNNGEIFNTSKNKLQQCMVYDTGHIRWLNELERNWRFSTNFSIQSLNIFNIYCDTNAL